MPLTQTVMPPVEGRKVSIMKWFVEIVEFKTEQVVKRIECASERQADRVDGGANINLNHEEYFTRIVSEGQEESATESAA